MKLYFLFTALLLRLFNRDGPTTLTYPEVYRDESYVDIYHGIKIQDPYHWLEDLDSNETKNFIKLQNELTEPYLNECPSRLQIKSSLEKMEFSDMSIPRQYGNFYFYTEASASQNQRILYVQEFLFGKKRALVDPNEISPDGSTSLSKSFPSKNGELLAYGLAKKGSDWVTVHFKNVTSGEDFPDTLSNIKFTSLEWTVDGKGIFYSRYGYSLSNESKIGFETSVDSDLKVYYHLVGTSQINDILVAEFPENPSWFPNPRISHDGKYLLIFVRPHLGVNSLYYIDVNKFISNGLPELPLKHPIITNFESEYEYVTNVETLFILLTNRKAPNYRLVGINIENPDEYYWDNNLVPEDPSQVLVQATAVNRDQLILNYKHHVRTILQLRNLNGGKILKSFPLEVGTVYEQSGNEKSFEFFFKFVSIISPGTIYKIDLSDKNYPAESNMEVYRETHLSSFRPSEYILKQEFYVSKDGKTRVPMFIAHKRTISVGPDTPALLYGYGGFKISSEPYFETQNAVFMKNFNGVYAIANIRGGGEYGERWYNEGRLFNKQNVFDDFQAAAEYLISRNYTSSPKLTIIGISNGGLLTSTCSNQRPELYGAAIVQVGVTDMLRYQKFTAGSGWVGDFGTSDDEAMFRYLLSYSPLHNVRVPIGNKTQYPATLLITGDHDDRVVPSHSFKLIAELQHTVGKDPLQTNPLLIHTESDTGHGAGKPKWQKVQQATDILSFMCRALGLEFFKDEDVTE